MFLGRKFHLRTRDERGMSLVEIMIAATILTVGIMGFISAFQYISRAIHVSRARSIAVSLAQEKVENLRNIPYLKLMITTKAVTYDQLDEPLGVDAVNYPPEDITVGGIRFTRGVFVTFAQMQDSAITGTSLTYPDTGMKLITVDVFWKEGKTWKLLEYDNLYENTNVSPLDSTIYGRVTDDNGAVLPGAHVRVVEHPDWADYAGTNGSYLIQVQAGNYTVRASSVGYYNREVTDISLSSGTQQKVDFATPIRHLAIIATGTVTGKVWMNTGLVISQIAVSTVTRLGGLASSADVEYVELFNPTTFSINIWNNGTGEKYVTLDYDCENVAPVSCTDRSDAGFNLQYVSTYVPPGTYYLIASTESFYINGTLVHADAKYGTQNANYITYDDAGCLKISDAVSGAAIDTVGWDDNSNGDTAPCYEGSPIPDDSNSSSCPDGIGRGNQLVRVSSPPYSTDDSYCRAYDSGSNKLDFIFPELMCPGVDLSDGGMFDRTPHSTADGSKTVAAGKPAFDAGVMSMDNLGVSTVTRRVYQTSYGNQVPTAQFTLPGIAVGTWSILAASGTWLKQIDGVVVEQGVTKLIPNAATTPSGDADICLDSSTLDGYVAGTVTDAAGDPINVSVKVGDRTVSSAGGLYIVQASTGLALVSFNPAGAQSRYMEAVQSVTVETGEVTMLDMQLSQGGTLTGFVTTDGVTALANITVSATMGGLASGTGVTDNAGYFYIRLATTGTYTVEPVLDPLMLSIPLTSTATALTGQNIFVTTFTVTGAPGRLVGSIYRSGSLIRTGALIVASTKTISSTPPSIDAASSGGGAVYYAGSSKADGTYEIEVRGSTNTKYNVSAYIPVFSGSTVGITTKTYSDVDIRPSSTTYKDIYITP